MPSNRDNGCVVVSDWEQHPDVQYFNQGGELVDRVKTAYAIHDQHFKHSVRDFIESYHVTDDRIAESRAYQVGSFVQHYPELADRLLRGENVDLDAYGFNLDEWWTRSMRLYENLNCLFRGKDGNSMSELREFYQYMLTNYPQEVQSYGW
jgi:hypothetical protein